jgi:hypothetical protein
MDLRKFGRQLGEGVVSGAVVHDYEFKVFVGLGEYRIDCPFK